MKLPGGFLRRPPQMVISALLPAIGAVDRVRACFFNFYHACGSEARLIVDHAAAKGISAAERREGA